MDFFFKIVHAIQKLVNRSDKKIMLVPQKSASKASCNRSLESSLKADVASVIKDVPGSEKISNVSNAPTGLPTASGITSRRKRKKKKEANEDKELVSKIMRGNVLQRNTRQQQEFEYLESGNEKYSIYIFLLNLML